jgi:hypothetical protein
VSAGKRVDEFWFPTFEEVVLAWMRADEHGDDVVEVVGVDAVGTDWAGDTEGGFYPEFELTIRYRTNSRRNERLQVFGEDLAELWRFVMRSWPSPAEVQASVRDAAR